MQDGRGWKVSRAFDDLVLPERVASMVRRSLQLLNPDDLRLLRLASIEGEVFTGDILQALTGEDEFVLDERLTKLDAASDLITYAGDLEYPDRELTSRYRFAHALYQNTLYEELTGKQRVLLHRKAAERLEQRYARQPELAAVQIAFHLDRGRDYERAAGWYRRAGERAAEEMGFPEAANHYRRARECLDMVRPDALDEAGELIESEARARMSAGDWGAIAALYDDLAVRAEAAQSDAWRARALYNQGMLLAYANQPDAALHKMEQGLELARTSSDELTEARVLVLRSMTRWAYFGNTAQAVAENRRLAPTLQRLGDPLLLGESVGLQGFALHHQGHSREGMRLTEEAIGFARAARSGIYVLMGTQNYGMAAAGCGEYRKAHEALVRARTLAEQTGEVMSRAEVPNILGYIHREFADSSRARELDTESLETGRALNRPEAEANALVNLGDHAYAAGDRHGALAYYQNALAQRQRDAINWWRYTTRLRCSQAAACPRAPAP